MPFQKSSEVWLPIDCLAQEVEDFSREVLMQLHARVCTGGMFLLFDSCTCSDECYLITQLFSCLPSGLLGET